MIARSLALTAAMLAAPALAADRALLIGINDYSNVEGAPVLNGAVGDVARMEAVLTGHLGFNANSITTLMDMEATYDRILSTLIDRIVAETRPGDRAVLYFAGLGTTTSDGEPAILAYDGGAILGQIPLATLSEILALIADRDVTVILDAGFDGGAPGTRGVPGAVPPTDLTLGDGITLWTATTGGQFAWEDIDRGLFTTLWTEAIATGAADENADGTLTNGELLGHVSTRMGDWCDALPDCLTSGRGLAPQFVGDPDGSLTKLERPEPPGEPLEPIAIDDGAPASYRETLGFVTDLFAPSNAAGLSLALAGGDTLQIGQYITMTAEASRPGALLLLDVDPNGALSQIYPSRLSAEGSTDIQPGRPLTIPSALGVNGKPLRMRVTEPSGQGLLLALFIEGDLPQLTSLLPAGLSGGAIPEAGQSLYEISQTLLQLEADPNRQVAWSATYLPYRIER